MTDQLHPFPAQTDTARRKGKKAAEHTAPCCRKEQLEEDGVTALKVVAREHLARWDCYAYEGDHAVRLTLFPSLTTRQGRMSKLTAAPLYEHKEESLLL
jgi:hypothetical protein